MLGKHILALALLTVVGTSGAAFAAQSSNDAAYATKDRHQVAMQGDRAAAVEHFFKGNPPEGWPYSPE